MHKPAMLLNPEEEIKAREIAREQLRPLYEVRRELIQEKKKAEFVYSLPLTTKECKTLLHLLHDSLINGGYCMDDKDKIISLISRVADLKAKELQQ